MTKRQTFGLLVSAIGAVAALTQRPVLAAERSSAVYCQSTHGSWQMFAAKIQPDGTVLFGLSLWQGPQNIGVYGVAARQGDHWEYAKDMDAKDPDARCRVTIGFRPDGDASVTGDATATCQGGVDYNPERDAIFSGGVGTQIGHVRFRRKYNLGPVTVELNDPDSFFAGSGLLETKRCNDLAQPSG